MAQTIKFCPRLVGLACNDKKSVDEIGIVLAGLAAASFNTFKEVKWTERESQAIMRAFEIFAVSSDAAVNLAASRVRNRWMARIQPPDCRKEEKDAKDKKHKTKKDKKLKKWCN